MLDQEFAHRMNTVQSMSYYRSIVVAIFPEYTVNWKNKEISKSTYDPTEIRIF